MSEQEQEDKRNSANVDGDNITLGDIKDANAIAVGNQAKAQITNNYYGSQSLDGKPYTLTLDDWHKTCNAIIEEQKQTRLTTNSLTYRDGVSFSLNDVYVPVELVEQKQPLKHNSDILPEQSSLLYLPQEESIADNDFFEKVLYQGKSEKSKELRIAIIGEPGSGKTTLLQKIADWLLNTQQEIVIWLSLSNLQNKNLKEYLEEVWLEAALPYISPNSANVTEATKNTLSKLFNSDRVWLLLDGVDEMNADGGNSYPLTAIAKSLTGWVGKARVILTCRLNVWDVENNKLEIFNIYRTLQFSNHNNSSYNQIQTFIKNWFKDIPQQGKLLQTALNQPGNERLKDLVKNPLRLAILCHIWQLEEGNFPDTKNKLYSQYVKAIYGWKEEFLNKDRNQNQKQQEQLNQALGELAIRAIENRESRFRLQESFVRELLNKPETELFSLALNIGWLNRVGETIEKPKEDVYAFIHGTFQEYFAAQIITDWRYFINCEYYNYKPIKYRIFAPHWKEVILLWIQQPEAKVSIKQKQEFIEALVDFKDKDYSDNIFKTCTFLAAECLIAAGLTDHPLYDFIYHKIVEIYHYSPYKLLRGQGFKVLKLFDKTSQFTFLKQELIPDNENRYLKAIEALGELGTEQAVELLANQYLQEWQEPVLIVNTLMGINIPQAKEKSAEILEKLTEDEEKSIISEIINQFVNAHGLDYINLLIDILQKSQTPQWMESIIFKQLGNVNSPQVKDIFMKHLEQALEENNILRTVDLLNNINCAVEKNIVVRIKELLQSEESNLVTASIRFLARYHCISREKLVVLSKQNSNQYELQKEIFQALIQIQNSEAEKDAIEICKSQYESGYFVQWIDTLGKFGNVFSFEYLSEKLHLLIKDLAGDRKLEVSIIKALYQISKRLGDNQTVNQYNILCQDILQHLQISGCNDDYLAEAAVYFLFKIGNTDSMRILLKLAEIEEYLLIHEAFLRYVNQYQFKSEYQDLINNWLIERVEVDDEYLEILYFNIKIRLTPEKEKKREIVINALEGDKPLLYREALSIACNLLQLEEILSRAHKFLNSSEFLVVEKTIKLLGKIGDAAAVYQLLPFLQNKQYQQEAFEALFNIAERHILFGNRMFQDTSS